MAAAAVELAVADMTRGATDVNGLSGLDLGDAECNKLAEALAVSPAVLSLDLHTNRIGDDGCIMLSEALALHPSLQTLVLDRNNIGDAGCSKLANGLAVNSSLRQLSLISNQISAAGCRDLVQALAVNTSLQSLHLDVNHLGDEGSVQLATALALNTSLLTLGLACCDIGDQGCIKLAVALSVNSSLQRLVLHGNHIEDAGCSKLAVALAVNSSLQELDLHSNRISDAGCSKLAEALGVNCSLRGLLLGENGIAGTGFGKLAGALEVNSTLQMLQHIMIPSSNMCDPRILAYDPRKAAALHKKKPSIIAQGLALQQAVLAAAVRLPPALDHPALVAVRSALEKTTAALGAAKKTAKRWKAACKQEQAKVKKLIATQEATAAKCQAAEARVLELERELTACQLSLGEARTRALLADQLSVDGIIATVLDPLAPTAAEVAGAAAAQGMKRSVAEVVLQHAQMQARHMSPELAEHQLLTAVAAGAHAAAPGADAAASGADAAAPGADAAASGADAAAPGADAAAAGADAAAPGADAAAPGADAAAAGADAAAAGADATAGFRAAQEWKKDVHYRIEGEEPLNKRPNGRMEGACSLVYRIRRVGFSRPLVLKVLLSYRQDVDLAVTERTLNTKLVRRYSNEFLLPQLAPHMHVVRVLHHFSGEMAEFAPHVHELLRDSLADRTMCVVMPEFPISLQRLVEEVADKGVGWVGETKAAKLLLQLLLALLHLKSHNLAHCDIKPDNVLLDPSTWHAALSDFGMARQLVSAARMPVPVGHAAQLYGGNSLTRAPEVKMLLTVPDAALPDTRKTMADVFAKAEEFACGATLLVTLLGDGGLFGDSGAPGWRPPALPADSYSAGFRAVLQQLLTVDPAQRLSATAAVLMLGVLMWRRDLVPSAGAPSVGTGHTGEHDGVDAVLRLQYLQVAQQAALARCGGHVPTLLAQVAGELDAVCKPPLLAEGAAMADGRAV